MPTLEELDKEFEKEQKRIKKRFKAGKLYPLSDIPIQPEPPIPRIKLEESTDEDHRSIKY